MSLHNLDRNQVDFLLIGAQKSGTTSLWKHIVAHPQTYLPATKEVEFFSDSQRFERGLDWYWQTYFEDAPPHACKGEATTQYMMFPQVPGRIHDAFPEVKLLALLRNPIDRAYSHYRMTAMRGHESRSFEECIAALQSASGADAPIDLHHDYLRLGEYGRILGNYLLRFERQQFCLVFTEDLEADPVTLIRKVYQFLEIDPDFCPDNIEKRFNVSGDQPVPALSELVRRVVGKARRLPLLNRVISQDRYEAFKFWTRTELKVNTSPTAGPNATMRALLRAHFAPDVARLRRNFGVDIPWSEFT
ncbi:MAG: sulfotransferase domain-containing protein [Myxococcales bacterium]|nr:sulfotransferase domain-containing protein [Myxococcales bacterium]